MKKIYSTPATEVVASVAESGIMLSISQTPADPEQPVLVKESEEWNVFE